MPFANETEVYEEFAKLEAHVQRIKQLALQLVQITAAERENGVGAAHHAFRTVFPDANQEE